MFPCKRDGALPWHPSSQLVKEGQGKPICIHRTRRDFLTSGVRGGLPPSLACTTRAAPAAGLVPSKARNTDRLEVSFDPLIVRGRRINRLRRTAWAFGHLHRFAVPNAHREHVGFVSLTYQGIQDWRQRRISNCLNTVRDWCRRCGVPPHDHGAFLKNLSRERPGELSTAELELTVSGALSLSPDAIQRR